ncbi:MAG: glycoside hydrolase family 3 N-terminal domain-containing protein [Rickettsiaceae bacterium]|nr:glycoside hydrolase family 3 N-terminal domain-containing protein [Rickettsiaceae bacterium]
MIKPIIFGLSSTTLSEKEIQLFQKESAYGFILFARNIESKEQLIALTSSLKNIYPERSVPIFIDQEGGRVARIKPPISDVLYPAAGTFAEKYKDSPEMAKAETEENYQNLMAELKTFGIDSPCAPMCDIRWPGSNDSVIGDRSFGDNADQVIDLSLSAINGIKNSGGIPFIKHIPGHGRSAVDSHIGLPVIDTPLDELESSDFLVFKELSKDKDVWGMTAHIIYTALDKEHTATTSPIIVDYIRNKIGFTGTLVSDDINMYALHGAIGTKHMILKKIINLISKEKEWQQYSKDLNELFNIDSLPSQNPEMEEWCQNKLEEVNPEFLASLQNITKLSLEAGCDIILHCSGDIEEMTAVCKAC